MRKSSFGQNNETIFEHLIKWIRFKRIINHLPRGCRLVDLGCGYHGEFLCTVANLIQDGVGYDLSVNNSQLPDRISLKVADVSTKIPEKNQSADIITAMAVIEHFNHPIKIIKETNRILKPNGKLIITTPSPRAKFILELLAFRLKIIRQAEVADHKQYFDRKSLEQLLIKGGFMKQKIRIDSFEFGLNLYAEAVK